MYASSRIPFDERQRMAVLAVKNGVSSTFGCRSGAETDRLIRHIQTLGVECSGQYTSGRGWRVKLSNTLTLPSALLVS